MKRNCPFFGERPRHRLCHWICAPPLPPPPSHTEIDQSNFIPLHRMKQFLGFGFGFFSGLSFLAFAAVDLLEDGRGVFRDLRGGDATIKWQGVRCQHGCHGCQSICVSTRVAKLSQNERLK